MLKRVLIISSVAFSYSFLLSLNLKKSNKAVKLQANTFESPIDSKTFLTNKVSNVLNTLIASGLVLTVAAKANADVFDESKFTSTQSGLKYFDLKVMLHYFYI
jgi:hypothetical protein